MRILLTVGLLLLSACATRPGVQSIPSPIPDGVAVDVVRETPDRLRATFSLPQDAPAWAFPRSAIGRFTDAPWRPDSWRIVTDGVRLDRIGEFDLLRADEGTVPRRVEIEFTPFTGLLIADYAPALEFSDGGLAIFADHFTLGPVDAEALSSPELAMPMLPRHQITFVDGTGGNILLDGAWYEERAVLGEASDTYAYFGDAEPSSTNGLALIVDAKIPAWIRRELVDFLPALIDYYTERLGVALPQDPTIYAVWDGADFDGASQGGSVLPNFLAANFGGRGLLTENPDALRRLRQFYAHEAAHFWNGGVVRNVEREHSWIHEGGADALAIEAMAHLTDDYDFEAAIGRAVDSCRKHGGGDPLNTAAAEGRHRAAYDCGALSHVLVAAEIGGELPLTRLWAALIRRAAEMGGDYGKVDWLSTAEELGASAETVALIESYANAGLDAERFETEIVETSRTIGAFE